MSWSQSRNQSQNMDERAYSASSGRRPRDSVKTNGRTQPKSTSEEHGSRRNAGPEDKPGHSIRHKYDPSRSGDGVDNGANRERPEQSRCGCDLGLIVSKHEEITSPNQQDSRIDCRHDPQGGNDL
jgi:hypothetical protein